MKLPLDCIRNNASSGYRAGRAVRRASVDGRSVQAIV